MPKEGTHCICFSVILIDSVFKINKNYYSQVFLEECKYIVKKNKTNKFIDKDLKSFFSWRGFWRKKWCKLKY